MTTGTDILKEAVRLPPVERFKIVEGLLQSLDNPDLTLDEIWALEAESRLHACRSGKLSLIPMEDIFKDGK